MIEPSFFWRKYFDIYVVHRFQIIGNRVIKNIKEYLFKQLFQLKTDMLLSMAFTDLHVNCKLLNLDQRNLHDVLLI